MAILVEMGAVFRTGPNEIVGLHRVEMEYFESDAIGPSRSRKFVPSSAGVCRVPECVCRGDEVRTIVAVRVVVECNKTFLGVDLFPGVALVTRLPDGEVFEADEDRLRKIRLTKKGKGDNTDL